MKILILGAGGMIGHKMFERLGEKGFEVYGTLKQAKENYAQFNLFNDQNIFDHVDVLETSKITNLLNSLKPDAILNCVGITLRKPEIKDLEYCTKVNGQFPHFLSSWCEKNNSYLIHFSTDCVFSGKESPYTEDSAKTATDIYGTTKSQGEVTGPSALTLRGSMIGRELYGKTELLEWAFSQKNKKIKGFSKAIYTGVTTDVMADLVAKLLKSPQKLVGLYQVSSEPISKFDLLQLINQSFALNMMISEDSSYATSKILLSEMLSQKQGFHCPSWPDMINELTKDSK